MKCFATALKAHEAWLRGEPDGVRLDLSDEDLTRANLRRTNMTDAILRRTNMTAADLRRTNMTGADLTGAVLIVARLARADLTRAILTGATLRNANLTSAILTGAILTGTNMFRADLSGHTTLHKDRQRNYVLYVIPEAREPMFIAGCRTFTLAQACEHWGEDSERSQPEYIAAIEKWVAAQNTSQTAAGAGLTV